MIAFPIAQPQIDAGQAIRAKLIFNPTSGRPEDSAGQLAELLSHLQTWAIRAEVFLVHPASRLPVVAGNAVRRGIKLVVVAGGDGTIDAVASALVGTNATLGIVPLGTRNNIAASLAIPTNDIARAVELLRNGRRFKLDVGLAATGRRRRHFVETLTLGLASALYPAADDVQHGNLTRIGDLVSTLVAYPPSRVVLNLEDARERIETNAHVVAVVNMPFVGPNIRIASDVSFCDGRLDVFVFSNLSKLDLVGYAVQMIGGVPSDPRIQHYQVKGGSVEADPPMPVMADGIMLGEGTTKISLEPRGLYVIGNPAEDP